MIHLMIDSDDSMILNNSQHPLAVNGTFPNFQNSDFFSDSAALAEISTGFSPQGQTNQLIPNGFFEDLAPSQPNPCSQQTVFVDMVNNSHHTTQHSEHTNTTHNTNSVLTRPSQEQIQILEESINILTNTLL